MSLSNIFRSISASLTFSCLNPALNVKSVTKSKAGRSCFGMNYTLRFDEGEEEVETSGGLLLVRAFCLAIWDARLLRREDEDEFGSIERIIMA